MSRPRENPQTLSMDTVCGHKIQAAGVAWDAVRVPHSAGLRVLTLLGSSSGAVVQDEPALYWFVPTGSAASWDVPGTRSLGLTHYLVVPPTHRVQGPGLHWRIPPDDGALITEVDALRIAVQYAMAPLGTAITGTT
ncbi:hypothetical protein [Streptomyces boluensis]|uniref:hypothetical protein n=1 Tax=Streptomyces boluensis TaxID=1775135 RepID=UPI001FE30036|nr:hypothetical protein [Streptomyces boluensis]